MTEAREIIEDENKITTVIGPDIDFRGTLKFKSSLKIKGNFHGKIESDGQLIIGKDAVVNADINSKVVSVSGTVSGKIRASQRIELFKKSATSGDLVSQDLTIESGAVFNGSSIMVKQQ